MSMLFWLYLAVIILLPLLITLTKRRSRDRLAALARRNEQLEKPKILYLRSFSADDKGQEVAPTPFTPFAGLTGHQMLPDEIPIANALAPFAQLVAVGKPGEEIPEIGFNRRYFSDEAWQSEVLQLMKESILIIYRIDSSDGVLWEFDQIMKNNYQEKVIIWTLAADSAFPVVQKAKFNVFRRKVFQNFQLQLPEYSMFKKFLVCENGNEWNWIWNIGACDIVKDLIHNNRK